MLDITIINKGIIALKHTEKIQKRETVHFRK